VTAIQLILIALLVAGLSLCVWSLRSHLITRLAAVLIISSGILCVVRPELTNYIAHRVGVQRGADLMFYLFEVGAIYGFLVLYVRQRALQEKLIRLARMFAIQHVRHADTDG
jgi:hypothetical protein